jgi:hypothetical protein
VGFQPVDHETIVFRTQMTQMQQDFHRLFRGFDSAQPPEYSVVPRETKRPAENHELTTTNY